MHMFLIIQVPVTADISLDSLEFDRDDLKSAVAELACHLGKIWKIYKAFFVKFISSFPQIKVN